MKFTYKSGQRVLDGFTLKRGVGQGGFGEVYFAVSDGGKEVALKLLRGHTDIELRGVANCLNLKHPNLVHVYDLRDDEHGNTWLVMEYVLGESLSQVISRHPTGLPLNLAKEWALSLCRAIGYLHDHGVVHRDIKPANIFIENGTLKVGDYGLCKTLQSSQQKQTRTVGTVHYMAPEISTGNYNKSIDLYAIGVVLYEMLTGEPPFDGESDGEILMKHLTATPDLAKVPQVFKALVAKALDKNPVRRFSSALELRQAIEAVNITESLPVASAVPVTAAVPVAIPLPPLPPAVPSPGSPAAPELMVPLPSVVESPKPASTLNASPTTPPLPQAKPVEYGWRERVIHSTAAMLKVPFFVGLALVPYALISQTDNFALLGKILLMTTALSWALLLGAGHMTYHAKDDWPARLRLVFLGALVGVLLFWSDGWAMPRYAPHEPLTSEEMSVFRVFHVPSEGFSIGLRYMLYFGLVLGIARWWRTVARNRKERFTLFPPMVAAFWCWVLTFLWPMSTNHMMTFALLPMVLATVVVQIACSWTPPALIINKKLKLQTA